MKLGDLIAGVGGLRVSGDHDCEISGLAYDSRAVARGDLFFSTARDPDRQPAYLKQALSRGAHAVVTRKWRGEEMRSAATVIECERPRQLMGVAAGRFFNHPSRSLDLVGITGTSGKTTTAYLLRSIFDAAGRPAGMIGTIGVFARERKLMSGLTTPEAIDFERALASMRAEGIGSVAAEISSIGLEEGRVDALSFRAALFTNLGRDHLDYHGTPERYFAAKLRLFTEILPRSGHNDPVVIANGDDPYGREVLAVSGGRKLSFGLGGGCEVRALRSCIDVSGIRATITTPAGNFEITSPMLGEINLRNILGAAALSVALGIEADAVVEGVRRCSGAPGRLQAVGGPPGVKVLIDYAHKPEALEAVLTALRGLRPRRLLCVFGCGGDRDRGKRPLMGAFAGRLADVVIVTSDNPRSEEPEQIISEIEAGIATTALGARSETALRDANGYVLESDRRNAIALALRLAQPGDIVVIAGKGHETYQLVGARILDFDDAVVVKELTAVMPH